MFRVLLILFLFLAAQAKVGLEVKPAQLSVNYFPFSTKTLSFEVKNIGDKEVRVWIEGNKIEKDNFFVDLKIEPKSLKLKPGESKEIKVKVFSMKFDLVGIEIPNIFSKTIEGSIFVHYSINKKTILSYALALSISTISIHPIFLIFILLVFLLKLIHSFYQKFEKKLKQPIS